MLFRSDWELKYQLYYLLIEVYLAEYLPKAVYYLYQSTVQYVGIF